MTVKEIRKERSAIRKLRKRGESFDADDRMRQLFVDTLAAIVDGYHIGMSARKLAALANAALEADDDRLESLDT